MNDRPNKLIPVSAERPRISGRRDFASSDTCVGHSGSGIFSAVCAGFVGRADSAAGGSLVHDDVTPTAARLTTAIAHEAHTLQECQCLHRIPRLGRKGRVERWVTVAGCPTRRSWASAGSPADNGAGPAAMSTAPPGRSVGLPARSPPADLRNAGSASPVPAAPSLEQHP